MQLGLQYLDGCKASLQRHTQMFYFLFCTIPLSIALFVVGVIFNRCAGRVRNERVSCQSAGPPIDKSPSTIPDMNNLVRCVCRSHCLTFNSETQTYEGEGHLIPKSTAANHRQDDLLPQTLDTFTENVATQVLSRSSPPEVLNHHHPHLGIRNQDVGFHDQPPPDDFYLAVEAEIAYRCGWTPTNCSLAFAVAPPLTLKYRHPSTSEMRTPNREPYALDPRNTANAAYLENESRLCEILRGLERRQVSDLRDRLLTRLYEGLEKMEFHKEMEWNRQRAGSIAQHHGYSVVDTGTRNFLVTKTPSSMCSG